LPFDRISAPLIALLVLTACEPADPEGTTARILSSHVLRAGLSENRPWIWLENGRGAGPEARLVEAFAQSLGAHVAWTRGAESALVGRLAKRELDLVAGGFTSSVPWTSDMGASRSYDGSSMTRPGHVILTAPGENRLLLRLDRFLAQADHA